MLCVCVCRLSTEVTFVYFILCGKETTSLNSATSVAVVEV